MLQEILTERLCLRRIQRTDAEALYAYRSLPELRKFLSWPKSMQALYSTISRLRGKAFFAGSDQLAIERRSDGRLVGDCAVRLDETDSRIAELGIALAPEFQSKGYASEALTALFEALFTVHEIHRVFTSVDPRNLPSLALMERLGMRKEAHFIQSRWFGDEWVDDVIYGMLASEWTQD